MFLLMCVDGLVSSWPQTEMGKMSPVGCQEGVPKDHTSRCAELYFHWLVQAGPSQKCCLSDWVEQVLAGSWQGQPRGVHGALTLQLEPAYIASPACL